MEFIFVNSALKIQCQIVKNTHWVNILLVDLVVQLIIGCLDKKASRNKIVKCQTLRQYLS